MAKIKSTPKLGEINNRQKTNYSKDGVMVFKVYYEDYYGTTNMTALFQRGHVDHDETNLNKYVGYFFSDELKHGIQLGENCPEMYPRSITAYEVFGDPFDASSEERFIKQYDF